MFHCLKIETKTKSVVCYVFLSTRNDRDGIHALLRFQVAFSTSTIASVNKAPAAVYVTAFIMADDLDTAQLNKVGAFYIVSDAFTSYCRRANMRVSSLCSATALSDSGKCIHWTTGYQRGVQGTCVLMHTLTRYVLTRFLYTASLSLPNDGLACHACWSSRIIANTTNLKTYI